MPLPEQDVTILARESGWRPKEEFRGDPEKWVDASTWVSRAENFLPLIKADRDRFRQDNEQLRNSLKETNELLKASQEAIAALKEHQTVATRRQVAQAEAALKARLREARDSGNLDQELEIQEELSELREAREAVAPAPAPAPKPAAAPAAPAEDPQTTAWIAANPWFKDNARKRGYAMGVADEIRSSNPTLKGKDFFDALDRALADDPVINPPAPNKYSSGNTPGSGSSGGSGASSKKRGYADLPADAKAACDSMQSKLVGPGRAYKTADEWRAEYAKTFFDME